MPHPRTQFQLLIKPAGSRCNLRCTYCFYAGNDRFFEPPGERRGKAMSLETLDRLAKEFLSYRMEQSVLCWQGGEPTLCGLGFFRAAVEAEKRYGVDGQVVGNALQTNGVLLDAEWCKFLAEYHFLVGLSLDGPRKLHETYRGKTFEKVTQAAHTMREQGVEFNILCVVSQANARHGAEVYEWLVGQGFNEIQFIPAREVGADGSAAPFSVRGEEFGDFLLAAFERWYPRDVGVVNERVFNSLLSHFACGEPNLCTFRSRCGDYVAVERGGEIFPCDFYIQPEHKLGVLGERPLDEMFTVARQGFHQLKGQVDPACRECEWFPVCNGGCPRDREPSGRNAHCAGLKKFFAVAAPRLEGLARQLKRVRGY
ncbi:MAG TPA: anaerobic sulfatase maturase [Planctomycetota bacterium]|nr:anaerobic sulfatase maturase [Planctomycetota bacterium]